MRVRKRCGGEHRTDFYVTPRLETRSQSGYSEVCDAVIHLKRPERGPESLQQHLSASSSHTAL